MRRAFAVSLVAAAVGLVALAADTACSNVPGQFCRGPVINRKGGELSPDRDCTVCIEEQCCDLIGDCQGTDCANQVASAHACVLDAGRGAGAAEPGCTSSLVLATSKETYSCMRGKCGDRCGLPVCTLDPLVPPVGDIECDRCFSASCCAEVNACAKNRSCLLTLDCIIDRCGSELARLLTKDAQPLAAHLVEATCNADAGVAIDRTQNCFASCIEDFAPPGTDESAEGRCLAARAYECGADVACGEKCAATPKDAGSD